MSGVLKKRKFEENITEMRRKHDRQNVLRMLAETKLNSRENCSLLDEPAEHLTNIASGLRNFIKLKLATQENWELLIQHAKNGTQLGSALSLISSIELDGPKKWALLIQYAPCAELVVELLHFLNKPGSANSTTYDTLFKYRDFLLDIYERVFVSWDTPFSQSDFDQAIAEAKAEWEAQLKAQRLTFLMGAQSRVGAQSAVRFFKKENCSLAEPKVTQLIFDFLPKP